MIASVSGTVQRIEEDALVIQVGGIGLRVFAPSGVLETAPIAAQVITLQTHLHVRETGIALYGFSSREELELFQLLLAVSGVGPRLALAVLSTISPDQLTLALAREQPEVLQRVSGIGKKTAQRIMFQLKDKLQLERHPPGVTMLSDVDAEVIAALTALGYSVVEAQAAVQKLPRGPALELEARIRLALSSLGS